MDLATDKLIAMPRLDEPAYDVDVYKNSEGSQSVVVRQRINPSGLPFEGNHVVVDNYIEEYCLSIAEAVGLDGLHDIDLMTDIDGRPKLLEVNPRPSGSIAVSLSLGIPIIDAVISNRLGIQIPNTNISPKNSITITERHLWKM